MSFLNKIKGLGLYIINRSKIIEEVLNELKDDIAEMNRQQMLRGETSKGGPILPEYADSYLKTKRKLSQPSYVTLFKTGDFHSSIKTEVTRKRFELIATDEKTEKLLAKYGEDVLGLNDQNLKIIKDKIADRLNSKFKEAINV
jgi:hypothetical protein